MARRSGGVWSDSSDLMPWNTVWPDVEPRPRQAFVDLAGLDRVVGGLHQDRDVLLHVRIGFGRGLRDAARPWPWRWRRGSAWRSRDRSRTPGRRSRARRRTTPAPAGTAPARGAGSACIRCSWRPRPERPGAAGADLAAGAACAYVRMAPAAPADRARAIGEYERLGSWGTPVGRTAQHGRCVRRGAIPRRSRPAERPRDRTLNPVAGSARRNPRSVRRRCSRSAPFRPCLAPG